jgi:hypothetical protein
MLSHHRGGDVTPANVQETVKFDILGDRKLQFTDDAVWYFTEEMMVVPLPAVIATGILVRNKPIMYRDIKWVGPIMKRQWGMLALGILGFAGGLYWTLVTLQKGREGVIFCLCILAFFGIIPLWIFIQGRKFLAIASEKEVISFPMDRKKKQVRKAIELLRKFCPGGHVHWEVG